MPSVAIPSVGKMSKRGDGDENGSSFGGKSSNLRTVDTHGALSNDKDLENSSHYMPTNMSMKSQDVLMRPPHENTQNMV